MATLRCEALVLRSVDFGESDRILHLLVPGEGRLTAIAKGARRSVKRFSGTLDLFHHLRVQLERRGSGMARLDQATLVHGFGPLRTAPARFALGCYLLELLDRLAPEGASHGDAQRLFAFALEGLGAVAELPVDARLRILLELRALEALGLRPELRRCVRCGVEARGEGGAVAFLIAEGGPLCATCAARTPTGMSVGLGTLRALEQGLRFELPQLRRLVLSPVHLAEARVLLGRFHRFHLGVDLRSERFLDEMLPAAP